MNMKREIISKDAPSPIGPYSQAIQAGNMLFLSGQIALDPITGLLTNDSIEKETERVMHNIAAVLEAAGASFNHVVKSSIFLKNMDDFVTVNQVYGQFFSAPFPARETVQVAKLPKDVNVEISVIAVLN